MLNWVALYASVSYVFVSCFGFWCCPFSVHFSHWFHKYFFLSGLGADEQLGGYGRHRTVLLDCMERLVVIYMFFRGFCRESHQVFRNTCASAGIAAGENMCRLELLKDTARLWSRNLGVFACSRKYFLWLILQLFKLKLNTIILW